MVSDDDNNGRELPGSSSSHASSGASDERPAVWKEYPLGVLGRTSATAIQIMVPFCMGLPLVLVLNFVVGFLHEQHVFYNVTSSMGMPFSVWAPISQAIDQLLRGVIGPTFVLGYIAVAVIVWSTCLFDISMSRALVKAARAGASRDEVPTPEYVEAVIRGSFSGVNWLLGITGAIFALFGAISLYMAFDDSKPEWALYGVLLFLGSAVCGGLKRMVRKIIIPAHKRRREIIASWWTTEDEQRAWDAAHASEQRQRENESLPLTVTRDPRRRLAKRFLGVGAVTFIVSIIALFAVVFILYPQGTRFGAGDRADLPPEAEAVLRIVMLVVLVGVLASFGVMLIGGLIGGVSRRAERLALLRAAEADGPVRVDRTVLEDFSQRGSVILAVVLTIAGSMLFLYSVTALLLGYTDTDEFRDASTLFGQYRSTGLIALAVSVALIVVGAVWNRAAEGTGFVMRNLLLARWPMLPTDNTVKLKDGSRCTIPPRVGPALTPGTEQYRIVSEPEDSSDNSREDDQSESQT